MPSRKIDDLVPAMQTKAREFAGRMAEIGIPFMFTCTRRTQKEQDELWAQGRTKPGNKVTWTRNSKHVNGSAFDIAILSDGQPTWELKVSVNDNDVGDYYEAGQIGESIGLEWGGRWRSPDYPHFQLRTEVT
jgi:peptidoglycan L-alanyl-D-glutamate endopeptidase CwlK